MTLFRRSTIGSVNGGLRRSETVNHLLTKSMARVHGKLSRVYEGGQQMAHSPHNDSPVMIELVDGAVQNHGTAIMVLVVAAVGAVMSASVVYAIWCFVAG